MKRSILVTAAIVAAFFGASQPANAVASADYIPYLGAFGDPLGLTSPVYTDAIETGSIGEVESGYIPYLGGFGDPLGLTSPVYTDPMETGGIGEVDPGYFVDLGGFGDPLGLPSPVSTDATETGSIGEASSPRVDVRGFCEGEGKLLAERHYIGFCHLADDLNP